MEIYKQVILSSMEELLKTFSKSSVILCSFNNFKNLGSLKHLKSFKAVLFPGIKSLNGNTDTKSTIKFVLTNMMKI